MLGSVNHNGSYASSYAGKAEIGQNQSVHANRKIEDRSKTEPPKEPVAEYDEYIRSNGTRERFPGIYRLEHDENGMQKIGFECPESLEKGELAETIQETAETDPSPESTLKPDADDRLPELSEKEDHPKTDGDEESGMWCTVNTDRVDTEIKQVKEQVQIIEQKLQRASSEEERNNLERQLAKTKSELSLKDNDSYRKANAIYTFSEEKPAGG